MTDQDATANLFKSLRPTNPRPASVTRRSQGSNYQSYLDKAATGPNQQQTTPMTHQGSSVSRSNGLHSPAQNTPSSGPTNQNGMTSSDQYQSGNTANLLNLLKFSASSPSASKDVKPDTPGQTPSSSSRPTYGNVRKESSTAGVHGRGISASDLVAEFMGKSTTPATPSAPSQPPPVRSSSSNHQAFLLNLLNQQSTADVSTPSSRNKSPLRVFGTEESEKATPFEPENLPTPASATKKEPIFTYVNPFDQLAASSPRHTRSPVSSKERPLRKPSPGIYQPSALQKHPLHEADPTTGTASTNAPEDRTQVEALMGLGAPTKDPETIAQALEEVAEKADKEAERALENAEATDEATSVQLQDVGQEVLQDMQEELRETAADIKEELDKKENAEVLKATLGTPAAEAVMEIIDEAANGSGGDEWTSADERGRDGEEAEPVVPVYQFPQKPFVSLELQQKNLPDLYVRDASILEVTKFKKVFDQIDRTLAAASNEYIVYSSAKPGGFRMIRQDDGQQHLLYRGTGDRIFNVALSTARPGSLSHGSNAVIATGVSGTVYWVDVTNEEDAVFETSTLEKNGLVFPPTAAQADGSSNGQLKTRAKKTSRHPEFFAIGRGKSIQIVFPTHARQSSLLGKDRVIDTEQYFQDRNLKVNTGKASKDFCFSEDDTVMITINKAARLQLWNIQELIHGDNATASKLAPIEVKTPILSYVAASPSDKAWPTSVMCVDKARPYIKGCATRYIIVGMRQNHTLQLWDLLLGKAVQELSLPHSDDMDAMCSVCYHPPSAMITVGHPTRNSLYFIHLSTPRYNLPTMSQAKFIERLASKDSSLPKPEATSIMSDVREVSLARLGQLRSIDLLPSSGEQLKRSEDENEQVLFELYVTHSRGVDCISVRKDDVGWSDESKALKPLNAQDEGMLVINDLYDSRLAAASESTPNRTGTPSGQTAASQSKVSTKGEDQSSPVKAVKARYAERQAGTSATPQSSSADKTSKKKKKAQGVTENVVNETEKTAGEADKTVVETNKAAGEIQNTFGGVEKATGKAGSELAATSAATVATETAPFVAKHDVGSSQPFTSLPDRSLAAPETKTVKETNGAPNPAIDPSNSISKEDNKSLEHMVAAELEKSLKPSFDELYRKIDSDKQVANAMSNANQKAILHLVSEVLGDNVEKSLNRIITDHNKSEVIPAMAKSVSNAINQTVSEVLGRELHDNVPSILNQILSDAVVKAFQTPAILNSISNQITKSVLVSSEKSIKATLNDSVIPQLSSHTTALAHKSNSQTGQQIQDLLQKTNSRHGEHIRQIEHQHREYVQKSETLHRENTTKVDQLTSLVRELSETVRTMATAQSDFQQEILKLQEQAAQERHAFSVRETSRQQLSRSQSEAPNAGTVNTVTEPDRQTISPARAEIDTIATLMNEARYEEACITWLQSENKHTLFNTFFVRVNPSFVQELAPLISLSIAALVTDGFETASHLMERLNWLETVLKGIDPRDPDIAQVAPQILEVLVQRLEHGYMGIAERGGDQAALRRIPGLARMARGVKGLAVS